MIIDSGNVKFIEGSKKRGEELLIIIKKGNIYKKILKIKFKLKSNGEKDIYFFIPYHKSKTFNSFKFKANGKEKYIFDYKLIKEFNFKEESDRPKISYHNSGDIHLSFRGMERIFIKGISFDDIYENNSYTRGPRIGLQIYNFEKGFEDIDISGEKGDCYIFDYYELFKENKREGKFIEDILLLDIFIFPKKHYIYSKNEYNEDNFGRKFLKKIYGSKKNDKIVLGFLFLNTNFFYNTGILKYLKHKFSTRNGYYRLIFSSGKVDENGEWENIIVEFPKNNIFIKK